MSKKNFGKHARSTSEQTAHTLHTVSIGAAGALVGASLALGISPSGTPLAHAETTPSAPAQSQTQTPSTNNPSSSAPSTGVAKQSSSAQTNPLTATHNNPHSTSTASNAMQGRDRSATPTPQSSDRSATPTAPQQANPEVTLSEETKDKLPNMYAWGSTDNVYIESGQNQSVTFKFAAPKDGTKITKVAIFPDNNIGINSDNAKKFVEYRSDNPNAHQAYSGEYAFTAAADGSATLTMSKLYRDNHMAASGYAANRCIYVFGTKDGQETLLYTTNIVRAATLIPPKKTGSIVLRYDQKLEEKTIREKLQQALDAPTEAKDKKTSQPLTLREQIAAASKAFGVGVRDEKRNLTTTPDDPEKKIVIADKQAYDVNQVNTINTVTSAQGAKVTTYQTGVTNLKTYLVSDLGYKSDVLALTVARYDTRIDKPTVDDPTNVSQDVKNDIIKKLAALNHVAQDKVTINDKGEVSIDFEGVDAKDAPKIALRDLVLKKLAETDITVPTNDKATVIYNPLGYSKAELARIKQSIVDANKDNKELGLTSPDQISLEYITGDTVTAGHNAQGISNGQQENKITVKIKTDKAYAEFTSDVKAGKLTRLVDIRKDYNVSWKPDKTKIDGRDTDEGISWSNDSHTTIIYRYDPTAAKELKTEDIVKLLKATPKDGNAGLRELTGGETLEHEGKNGKVRKSHMNYALQGDEPTGELSLGNMSGAYWIGNQKVSHSDESLGDEQSSAGSYSWDKEAGSVTVAGKKNKIYKARLFVQPYQMSYYRDVYIEQGRNPGNTTKAINVIFVPQTNHKTSDLKTSVEGHKIVSVEGKDVPTESTYYNASDKKKEAYDNALQTAKTLYESVKDKQEKDLTEQEKAQIDNATINLNKARAELDGAKTNKEKLEASIGENGKAAEGTAAATPGTVTTDKYKNVSDPDFKDADGNADTKKNADAKKAKEAYDKALEEANKVKDDPNATQKAVDAAKANLDAARAKLNDFTTNKDELNAAIAADGKVNTGDPTKQGDEKLKTADPSYQNSTKEEREAYDKAVAQANKVVADPNASQKEVNEAIKKLKEAKAKLDAKATDKSKLAAAEKQSFDNPVPGDASKQSVFYKNANNKKDNGASDQEKQAAAKAVQDYDDALAKAREVLNNEKATQAQVDEAKQKLEAAEAALHADTYQTKTTDLAQALADNFSGYLMPAYFNAFDKAQKDGKDSQAAKDFKAYNDAYHAAKDLMENLKKPDSTITQEDVDVVKNQLIEARKIIDAYATDTSKLSAAAFNDLAIKLSPAYKNVSADDASEEAKAAKKKYDEAVEKLHKALNNQLPKDQADGADIPDSNIPDRDGDLTDKNYLKNIQAHKNGEPLDRDVTAILKEMNDAKKELDKFATKTDELLKSINKDSDTHPSPAFKNASVHQYLGNDGTPDVAKNTAARKAASDYGEALNKAKDLLKDPTATQKDINDAKTALDNARKELDKYNTDTTKLTESVEKHGKDAEGANPAVEGTKDSDAYRNASDPHFMKVDPNDATKLVEDTQKNDEAKKAKANYDKALAEAQELLKKADPNNKTPLDAQPTQQEINDALKALDEARTKLDAYKTDTSKLDEEAQKSTADGAAQPTAGSFEDSPEFKNADAEQSEDAKEDVKAYKEALKKARELVKAATDPHTKNSDRPTQQQINEALDALKAAKKQITDNYKTNLEALTAAKDFAKGNFTNTPEYKNAAALKDDAGAKPEEKDQAKADVDALDENTNDSALKKAKDIIDNPTGKTQKEVDDALEALKKAMDKVTENYKTNADKLKNEVGDKDEHGKDVIPPFEATVEYKNALEQAKTEENKTDPNSATEKLKAYAEKVKAAQKLIDQVNNPDPNAKPEDRPTQKQVNEALEALKQAKKDITDNFKTKVEKLQNEVDDKDETGVARTPKFEESTEYKNLTEKIKDGKDRDDLVAYKLALAKAKELIDKNDGKITKDGHEIDVPKEKLPTQQEVDDAQKALKEIKDKILANYKTNPTELNEEVLQSQDGKTREERAKDTNPNAFEKTAAFRNAENAEKKGVKDAEQKAAEQKIKTYEDKLDAAKKLLEAFDLVNGGVKNPLPAGMTQAPTQAQLDAALAALQEAKNAITDNYNTNAENLRAEINNDFTNTQPYKNVIADWGEADLANNPYVAEYLKALNDAKAVLDRHDGRYDAKDKPTQKEVDDALAALKRAEKALSDAYKEPHGFLDPATYGNTPSDDSAGGAGGAGEGTNAGDAGNAQAHDENANEQNEGEHANHDANHDTDHNADTNVHQPQHAAHDNTNAEANANAGANANGAADALGENAAQTPDGSKADKDTNSNNARLPKTGDALPLYANSAAVLVAIAVLTRTNRRRKQNRL
ncbi:hypothetical protein ACTQKJ_04310 [Eggerthellaceae bacterium PR-HUZ602407-17]